MERSLLFLNKLLKINDVIVVSCSGGPDSMCLLSLIVSLKNQYNLKIICAHVNHQVRKESNDEEKFVKEYCEQNDIIFELLTITKYGHKNFHDDARVQRYDFLNKLMNKYKAKYLMTAHHGDDLIETIFMRIQRGSNLTGYAGFKQIMDHNNYQVIRPLIYNTKSEIKAYDDKNNIKYVIDKTNFLDDYTRNRYRNHILPLLKKEDENIHLKFLKYSEELYKYDKFIKDLIIKKQIIVDNNIDIKKYNMEDDFLKTKIIEYYISLIQQNNEFYVTDSLITEIKKLINSNKVNGKINLTNNFIGVKSYNNFIIVKDNSTIEYNYELSDELELKNWVIKTNVTTKENSNYEFRFLSDEINLPLYIRTRKNGDKIWVKNLNGSKKIKDIFINNKIPMEKRNDWPIIVDASNNILGIPGIKKSKFDKEITQKYDIIIKCEEK